MRKICWLIKILYVPEMFYLAFFILKFTGNEPPTDLNGMHALMGAFFLSGGTAICYFMSILPDWNPYQLGGRMRSRFWLLSTLLFALLLSDAAWRIHENVGFAYPALHNVAFLVYGALLVLLVWIYRESFHTPFWGFLVGFVFLSGIAVLSDSFLGEGIVRIGEWDASFEQFCETLCTIVLACAFASEAIEDLRTIKWTAQ